MYAILWNGKQVNSASSLEMAKRIKAGTERDYGPLPVGTLTIVKRCYSKGRNGVSRNGIVGRRGNSEMMPCGHEKRLTVAGKCVACERYGATLEAQ